MHQIIVELDDKTMERLDRVAPARARKRSQFIREAIRRALNERLEQVMEEAYREKPQDEGEPDLDPATWEAPPAKTRRRGSRR